MSDSYFTIVSCRRCRTISQLHSLTKDAGAVLEEMPPNDEISSMKFAGSTLMVLASSKEEVVDLLKDDVYVKSGVWDLEKVGDDNLPHQTIYVL